MRGSSTKGHAIVLLDVTSVMNTSLSTEAEIGFVLKLDERLLVSYHRYEATIIATKQRKHVRAPEWQWYISVFKAAADMIRPMWVLVSSVHFSVRRATWNGEANEKT